MEFYFLDRVSWQHSQALYHAAAHLGRDVLFVLRPATPYACLGYHQDARQEINLEFAQQQNIPVFRREVGGGAVYLDGEQLFFQLIINSKHPEVPENKEAFYRKFLGPVIDTFRDFGVPAEYKPVNDILSNGRKISGTGAAEIEGMNILVGNFIIDFPYEMMSKILRVPDEKFRDKVYKTLQENLTTMLRETGSAPETRDLALALAKHYEPLLGPLEMKTEVDPVIAAKAEELFAEMYTDEWLYDNDRRSLNNREVKIRDGVYVVQNAIKSPGGLIRVTAVNDQGKLRDVHLSGDFFFFPQASLEDMEKALEGVPASQDEIAAAVQDFYTQFSIESPGVQPADFAKALAPSA